MTLPDRITLQLCWNDAETLRSAGINLQRAFLERPDLFPDPAQQRTIQRAIQNIRDALVYKGNEVTF
jgi:hypothetical protein